MSRAPSPRPGPRRYEIMSDTDVLATFSTLGEALDALLVDDELREELRVLEVGEDGVVIRQV